jgi:hypothetical protein
MLRRTVFLQFRDSASPERIRDFLQAVRDAPKHIPSVLGKQIGENLIARTPAQGYMLDTLFENREALQAYNADPYHLEVLRPHFQQGDPRWIVERAEAVFFEPMGEVIAEPEIGNFLKRSLIVRIPEETPPDKVELFEKQIMEMPSHIPAIRNWVFARAAQDVHKTRWTHIWEMEIQDAEAFQDYLLSPFHWGVVDLWFNPEWPDQQIVDKEFLHGYYQAPRTVLGWAGEVKAGHR